MKQAIVTGATGFIGSAFIEFLNQNGIDVIAVGRRNVAEILTSRMKMLRQASYFQVEMQHIKQFPRMLQEREIEISDDCVFYNLAWGGDTGLSDLNIKSQLRNVSESLDALDIACEIGCRKFIQIGTMEEVFALKYLEEDHRQLSRKNRHIVYALAKISARRILKVKSGSLPIEYNYVNHSHVMGQGDDKDSFLQVTLTKLINDEELIFSSGEQIFDVISLEDCVEGYRLVGEFGRSGEDYWVGSGSPRRLREYVEIMYQMFPSSQNMKFGSLGYEEVIVDPSQFSTDNLIADTGFQPRISYEESVRKLFNSMRRT